MTSVWGRVAACLLVLLISIEAVPVLGANLGFKVGLAVSDQFKHDGDTYSPFPDNTEATRELTMGLLLAFPLGRWRLVPTVSYLTKGSYGSYVFPDDATGSYGYASVNSSRTYLSCQSDVHFTFPLGSAGFYFLASPRVDILLDHDRSVQAQYGGSTPSALSVPPFHTVTVGGALGLGQDISVGDHVLFMEFRYDRDISPYWEIPFEDWTASSSSTMKTASFYNRSFLFHLGIRLNVAPHEKPTKSTNLWPAKE